MNNAYKFLGVQVNDDLATPVLNAAVKGAAGFIT